MVSITSPIEARPAEPALSGLVAASSRMSHAGAALVLLACAYAAMSQGAFYPGQLRVATLLVVAGLTVTLIATGLTRSDLGAPTVAAFALGSWYLIAGALAHDVSGAIPAL